MNRIEDTLRGAKPAASPRATRTGESATDKLRDAYAMELCSLLDYLALSSWMGDDPFGDSTRLQRCLRGAVSENLELAQRIATEIRAHGGTVPAAAELRRKYFIPATSRVECNEPSSIVRCVIEREDDAVSRYRKLIAECSVKNPSTTGLAVRLLGEHRHRLDLLRQFEKGHDFSAHDGNDIPDGDDDDCSSSKYGE